MSWKRNTTCSHGPLNGRGGGGHEGHCLPADECQQCASNVRTLRLLLMPSFDGYHCVPQQQQCRAGAVVGGVWQISPIITHHISLRNAALPAWEPHNNQPATSTDWLIRVLPIEFQPYFDADILSTALIMFLQQDSNSFTLDKKITCVCKIGWIQGYGRRSTTVQVKRH